MEADCCQIEPSLMFTIPNQPELNNETMSQKTTAKSKSKNNGQQKYPKTVTQNKQNPKI